MLRFLFTNDYVIRLNLAALIPYAKEMRSFYERSQEIHFSFLGRGGEVSFRSRGSRMKKNGICFRGEAATLFLAQTYLLL